MNKRRNEERGEKFFPRRKDEEGGEKFLRGGGMRKSITKV